MAMSWAGMKPAIALLLGTSLLFIASKLSSLSEHYAKTLNVKEQHDKGLNDAKQESIENDTKQESGGMEMDLNGSISISDGRDLNNASRILWQKWRTRELPDIIDRYWKTIMEKNPTYDHRVMGDVEATEFMTEHFRGPTADAFESTNPAIGAMRADMWRYCVLYKYGGVYIDIDAHLPRTGWKLDEWIDQRGILSCQPQAFEEYCVNKMGCPDVWASVNMTLDEPSVGHCPFTQWMLVFPKPGNPILRETIQLFTSLITAWNDTKQSQKWKMTKKVMCLTGPCMFAAAIQRAYVAANGELDNLGVDWMGVNYEGKAIWENPKLKKAMNQASKHYRTFRKTVPVKPKNSN